MCREKKKGLLDQIYKACKNVKFLKTYGYLLYYSSGYLWNVFDSV